MTEPMPMPPPEKAHPNVAKPTKSKGEKLFDKITYVGIAGIGTLVVTVPVAYGLEHNPSLKPWFDKAVAKTESLLAKFHFENPRKTASKVVKTTTLMQGGNLTLIPVALMEHYKIPIVRGLNAAAKDPTPEEQIEKAPKQTFSSLVKSRVLSWAVVFGAFIGVSKAFPKAFEAFEDEFGLHTVKLTNRFRSAAKQVSEKAPHGSVPYEYGKIAALDVFATAAAATLLYLGGHFFARKQEQKKELREEHKALAHAPMHRDAVEQIAIGTSDVPGLQVAGSKQHEGTASAAPALAHEV